MESLYSLLKSNFEKYSLKGLDVKLNKLNDDELIYLLKEVSKNTNLINQFPNSKISNFRESLKLYYLERDIKTQFFSNIETIENLYKVILDNKIKIDEITLFQNLFNFSKLKYNQVSDLTKMELKEGEVLNEKQLKLDSINSEIETLCKIVNYNLQSMFYLKPEFSNEKNEIVLPYEVLENKNCENYLLENILSNTGIWDILQDIDYNFKFFNDDFNKSIINEKNEISVKTSDLQLYSMIAMQRMQSIHTNTLVDQYRSFGSILKKMDSTKKEYIFLQSLFYRLYFINIDEDKKEYNGLTIKEWFLGFLSLREISEINEFSTVSIEEIKKIFTKNGILDKKHLIIIDNLTYKREKRADLYDTPIIKVNNDSYFIFPLTIKYSNIEKVLASIFSKLDLHIVDKGKLFEKDVIETLRKQEKNINFKVSEVSFKVKGEPKPQYQYDAVLEWDNYIFIIECKNRSIASTESISLNHFESKLDEYINQVNRLESGLINHSYKHKVNLNNKKIIKIVLNSLPFALDIFENDTYFIDYSSFLRFFSSKAISLEKVSGESNFKQPVVMLWGGDKPTVKDFLKYLNQPPQVLYFKEKVKFYETFHSLGEYKLKVDRYSWQV